MESRTLPGAEPQSYNTFLMSMPTREELLRRFAPVDAPEVMARRHHSLKVLLEMDPQLWQQLQLESRLEGRLTEARAALRRVLVRRQLTLSEDDDARIEACTELPTLERWRDQAVTAVSVSDALT